MIYQFDRLPLSCLPRLLGKWEESALALAAGQKCDYDDDTQELLKTVVKPNVSYDLVMIQSSCNTAYHENQPNVKTLDQIKIERQIFRFF